MKTYLSKVLCLLLCLVLVFSLSACNNKKASSETLPEGYDLEDDEENGGTGTGDNSLADISDDSGSSAANSNVAKAVKDADSLSWNELVAQMPSSLRGTTFNVFSWNPVTDVTDADKVVKKFETQTGITVKWTQGNYDTYDTKITALINADKAPDLIRYISPTPSRMYLCQDLKTATGFDFKGDIWDKRVTTS